MNTVDRCTCYQELLKHVGDSFARFRITEKDESCSEHGEVDHILASGRYTDKRGREWVRRLFLRPNNRWANIIRDSDGIGWPGEKISEDRMRLLIERDQHVCHGLRRCFDHPVPHVLSAEWDHSRFGGLMVYPAGDSLAIDEEYDTLSEAMDAARALAVGE